jgi:hypothetical protein
VEKCIRYYNDYFGWAVALGGRLPQESFHGNFFTHFDNRVENDSSFNFISHFRPARVAFLDNYLLFMICVHGLLPSYPGRLEASVQLIIWGMPGGTEVCMMIISTVEHEDYFPVEPAPFPRPVAPSPLTYPPTL